MSGSVEALLKGSSPPNSRSQELHWSSDSVNSRTGRAPPPSSLGSDTLRQHCRTLTSIPSKTGKLHFQKAIETRTPPIFATRNLHIISHTDLMVMGIPSLSLEEIFMTPSSAFLRPMLLVALQRLYVSHPSYSLKQTPGDGPSSIKYRHLLPTVF
ncbi:hypothetical protein LOZ52_003148 [Ophidiomyces ophidiicola]|uniref:Uncharacterized protein n=1 Tax=Ophidiomyces ophidiicola TaxID=1387563 RepID=A0ACB8UTX9_9EURO|nr:uncharacterized protein LOZ57_003666 [Ophidiomyces ophidiicola]KAI1946411.1 hypothetical protein LOZ57_003666 [Ophidiomyces ophidiicola]KAI1993608.1 hypothetical protein LOZ51_003987 [Ophidiomyces ophidiicola]KAI2005523.1 hypothetical protein LOZ50_003606 [Ophidiomyces ophidiicola]KAI2124407.1 hypothetical protein LOZ31_004241 [Ophidiomyces ophidiicola]KAI2138558.1 hypothetical protein LOZ29_002768 [Ophidiomyces ophidiicola]